MQTSLSKTFLALPLLALAGAALVLAPATGHAASVDATASVTIQKVVGITKAKDLAFGTLSGTFTDIGTANINAVSGGFSITGGVATMTGPARGEFDITGEPNVAVSVSFQDTTINLTGPGSPMSADLTLSNASPTLDGSGDAKVYVGGLLTIGASQVSGAYSGSFTVIANY